MKKLIILPLIFLISFLFIPLPVQAAASFGISGSRTLTSGQTITVTISANRNAAYNAIILNASFNNFTFIGTSATGGWTTISGPSRSGNSVSYSGALLGQSITGSRNAITLTLRAPSAPGTASITVSGTISGEGAGTGTESGSGSATFKINAAPIPPPATPTPKPAPGNILITSSSHPDQNNWYKNNTAVFSWTKENEVTDSSYILDNEPLTNPDDISEGGDISRTFENLVEGVQYFHIKAKNSIGWGPVSHYKISIDKTMPQPFSITAVKGAEGYQIFFATMDELSGVASYTVFADEASLGEKTSNFSLPLSTKEIKVIATDKSGNTSESIRNLIQSAISPTISGTTSPIAGNSDKNSGIYLAILGISALMLLVYSTVISYMYFRMQPKKQEISA